MKYLKLFMLFTIACTFISCNQNDDSPNTDLVDALVPTIKSLSEIRSNISVSSARPTTTTAEGKIYVSNNYLFYIAQESGIHIIDNRNIGNPENIAFINIEGVHDIAVKGNHLFADNYRDLLVFDISDVNNITLIQTVENVIEFYPTIVEDLPFWNTSAFPNENELIVGYHIEKKPISEIYTFEDFVDITLSNASDVGIGGSFAKFKLNDEMMHCTRLIRIA